MAFFLLLAVPSASAATNYWNNSGNGSWNVPGNWSLNAKPDSTSDVVLDNSLVTLPTTLGLDAPFTIKTLSFNTGTSVTLQANTSGSTTRILTLNGNGLGSADLLAVSGNTSVTISSNGTVGTLSLILGDSGKFNVGTGSTLDIAPVVSGASKSLEKTGGGNLILRGTNTFSGGVILSAGTLTLGADAAQGNGTMTINGGTISVTNARTTTNNNAQIWNGDWTFGGGGTWNTGTGSVTLNATAVQLTSSAANLITVGGAITGAGNLTLKTSAGGAITLTNPNNTGTITNSGTGTASTTLTTVGTNVTAITQNSTTSLLNVTTLNVASGGTTLTNTLGIKALTVTNAVAGTGNLTLNNNSSNSSMIVLTGGANNTGSVTNSGSGSGALTISSIGSNVTGVVQNSSTSALTVTTLNLNANGTTLVSGGTSAFTVNQTTAGAGNLTISANNSGNITLTAGANHTGTIVNNGSGSNTVTVGAIGANVASVTQNSASSKLSLSSANTYTGATTISAGTLILASAGTIANSSGVNLGTSGSRGTLDLTAKASGFTFGANQTLSGYGNVTMAAGKTLTIDGGLAPGNSPGVIAISGNLVLGSNSTTTMDLINNTQAAGVGFDQISLSGTNPALTYGGTLMLNLTGGTTLGVYHLFTGFSSQSGTFTIINYSLVGAAGSFNYATGDLTLTAVPEPSTWALLAFSLTTVMVLRRRRNS